MIDVNQVNATHRALGELAVATGEGRSVLLRRVYDADIEDVWDACTDPERLARWLGQVDGDLRPGGTYQLHGNAGGEILRCEQPRLIKVTWLFGESMPTELEVRLSPGDGGTVLELEHSSPAEILDELIRTYGPGGTIGVGCGWDLTLPGLHLHLSGAEFDPATWEETPSPKAPAMRGGRSSRPPGAPATRTSPPRSRSRRSTTPRTRQADLGLQPGPST